MLSSLFCSGARGVSVLALAIGTAFAAPIYTIKNLGVLPGGTSSVSRGINEAGQVTG